MERRSHKFFMGLTGVVILIVGLILGVFLSANLGSINLEIINLALALTAVILLLMIGGLILEVKELVEKTKKKR